MNTKDTNPEPYRLQHNHKGHYVLDIVHHLTKSCVNHDGQAHVVVRSPSSVPSSPSHEQQGLMLGTIWLDMTVRDAEFDEQELSAARDRMWRLYAAKLNSSFSSNARHWRCHNSLDNFFFAEQWRRRQRTCTARSGPGGCCPAGGVVSGQGSQSQGQKQTEVIRCGPADESGSKGSEGSSGPMALLRAPPTISARGQSSRAVVVCSVCNLRFRL